MHLIANLLRIEKFRYIFELDGINVTMLEIKNTMKSYVPKFKFNSIYKYEILHFLLPVIRISTSLWNFFSRKVRLYVCSWVFERGCGYKVARGVSFSCGAWLSARPPPRGGEDERNTRSCTRLAAPRVINAFGQRGKGQTRARSSLSRFYLHVHRADFLPFIFLGISAELPRTVRSVSREEGFVCVYDLIPGRSYVTLEGTAPSRPFEATKERQKKLRRQLLSREANNLRRHRTETNGALIEDRV